MERANELNLFFNRFRLNSPHLYPPTTLPDFHTASVPQMRLPSPTLIIFTLYTSNFWYRVVPLAKREMVVDFRRKWRVSQPPRILEEDVGTGEDYKYLGVHIDNGLQNQH
ncbi:unnamed protein product [Pleuronectes platessa]|uniref:Uncharacterized protein n=1 Tax=Pleuronectes platessa TaxID=8262 RepID=A0A9N7V7B7_PLEPL|nr:unnamed protein product [Pleuronectes platessa]